MSVGLFVASPSSVLADACSAKCVSDAGVVKTNCIELIAPNHSARAELIDVCETEFDQLILACVGVTCANGASGTVNSGAASGGTVSLTNPLGTTDPREIIGNLIKAVLSIIGSVTLLMFVYGGVLWITSMGNDKQVAKGKAVLVWAVAGLAIIAGAYAITNAIITGLTTGSAI